MELCVLIVLIGLLSFGDAGMVNRTSKKQETISQTILMDLPSGTELLKNQVAGHTFHIGSDDISILKDQQDGSVLKAADKSLRGVREIRFYENLMNNLSDPSIEALRKFVPEYRGTVKMSFRGKVIDFIRLADITHGMGEPCVIDIKIGKRTWDPLSTPQKIQIEEKKYELCTKNLGFCILGIQVYDIKTGWVKRFDRQYGRKLNQNTVKDALKIFLNAETQLSQLLLRKFLSTLWSIQAWARTQTSIRLYASSLLLAYDAERLKSQIFCNRNHSNSSKISSYGSLSRSSSVESISKLTPTSSSESESQPSNSNSTSENVNANGCYISNNDTISESCNGSSGDNNTESIEYHKQPQRSHSMQNNYEEDMKHICKDYDLYSDNLVNEGNASGVREWAFMKMIDFAHIFPAEDASIDTNYSFGIENLVKIFEEFLRES